MTLFLLFAPGSWAQRAPFEDVVFVDTNRMSGPKSSDLKAFFIDIFEVSGVDASRLEATIAYRKDRPGRMTLAQAQNVCAKRGMRLPTKEEWLAAASNLGANRRYTLRGDTINGSDYTRVNINTGDSIETHDLAIGMDAIGTLGMTGNRAEYFLNRNGTWGECGGKYETTSLVDVELSRICETPTDNAATARCVVEASNVERVTLTSKVPPKLLDYLKVRPNQGGEPRFFNGNLNDGLISPDAERDDRPLDGPQSPFEPL